MRYNRLFLSMMARARRRVPEPETEEVELQGGVKVKMPKEDLEKYRFARNKDKIERDALATIAAESKREKAAAEAEKAEIERKAAIEKAAAKGDMENVRKLASEESVAKLAKREKTAIREHLRARIGALYPKLDGDDLSDTIKLVAPLLRMNAETDDIEAIDEAGQLLNDPKTGRPMTADAVLQDFAKTRARFQKAKAPAGDGDVGKMGADHTFTHSISNRDMQRLLESGKWKGSEFHKAAQAKALRITDD